MVFSHVVAREPLDFAVVAAFLRLGKKYEIELFHAEALRSLCDKFPSNLKDLDECNKYSMIKEGFSTSVDVANLA